jgi:hypothetical protein
MKHGRNAPKKEEENFRSHQPQTLSDLLRLNTFKPEKESSTTETLNTNRKIGYR